MRRILLLCLILVVTLGSCKKECRFKKLPKIKCDKDFSNYEGTQYYYKIWSWPDVGYDPVYFRIDDSIDYDSLFNGTYPFGQIDFSTKTLLGIAVKTNLGDDIAHQGYVCKNETESILRFTAEYSLKWQCHGSGIYSINASFWAIIPKVSESIKVEYQLVDINPFGY